MDPISLHPIGYVESSIADADVARQRREMIVDIVIEPAYIEALTGLNEYSHLIVLFWMDQFEPSGEYLVHPRGDETLPLTGVLAARGRNHPNPLGLAVVELLGMQSNRLQVKKLDAYNRTPIVDIKPYDHYDVHNDIRVPAWFHARRKPRH